MKRKFFTHVVSLGMVALLTGTAFCWIPEPEGLSGRPQGKLPCTQNPCAPKGVLSLPLYFIENQGQFHGDVLFTLQGRDKILHFSPKGVTFLLPGGEEGHSLLEDGTRSSAPVFRQGRRWALKLDFLGADPQVGVRGEDRQEAVISYFKGKPEEWISGVSTYGKLVYSHLWPGIDLVYSGMVNQLKYEFVVNPGADPGQIRLAYRGASSLTVEEKGGLVVQTPAGGFEDARPYAYQVIEGAPVEIPIRYELEGESEEGRLLYGFHLGSYDADRTLILDPSMLLFCGFIGGNEYDVGFGIALDASGNVYLAGAAQSTEGSFPVTVGPDLTHNGDLDAFVAKVNAEGSTLLYCGYIGGEGVDVGRDIAVDSLGNAYITGETLSTETSFPVKGGPDLTHNGDWDGFVAKVLAGGTDLVYCGYIGGQGYDVSYGIAADSSENAYLSGETMSTELSFPVKIGPDLLHNGLLDAFVAKVKSDGSDLVYCGYVGGTGIDQGFSLALDSMQNVHITGETQSNEASFPVKTGPDLTYNGGEDTFVAKVAADGSALEYCGYIGGAGNEQGFGIAVDNTESAYVTGFTFSAENTFPVKNGPDLTYNGDWDAFVAKVAPGGSDLLYCGYVGGTDKDWGLDIAVDSLGNAYVTGFAASTEGSFPVKVGPDLTYNGDWDAFVAGVKADGSTLLTCGYLGGTGFEGGTGIAVDPLGSVYVTGGTESTEASFPVKGGPDLTSNGGSDAFVAKIPPYPILLRCGNVNAGIGDAADVLFVNGSPGDTLRVYTISTGKSVTMTLNAPPAGPNPADFCLYEIWWEPGAADVSKQPYAIGVSCMPMPLSTGTPAPPPVTIVNTMGYKRVLGTPVLSGIPPAPSTIFSLPSLPRGTYTFQGYIIDSGSGGFGASLTNAIVLKVF